MKLNYLLILFNFLPFAALYSTGQTNQTASHALRINIPETSSIALAGNSNDGVILNVQAPEESGHQWSFEHAKDSSIWLNYSVVKGSGEGQSKNVYVKIQDGTVPQGIVLTVQASDATGSGDGDMGTSGSQVQLNNNNQVLINGIGTCYTGKGIGQGCQLIYALQSSGEALDASDLNSQSLTICYTIAD
jgi:hypothetical protein